MDDCLDVAKNVVLEFVKAMNDWEMKMNVVSRIENDQYIRDNGRALVGSNTRVTLDSYYYETLKKYCTIKERKYGGHPTSGGKPPRYVGVEEETIQSVNQLNKNRIEVVVKSSYFGGKLYMFVVLRKGGEWRIDSLKRYGIEKWEIDYL